METEQIDELVDPKQQLKEKRGKTLPVICILTMVNVGWMVINSLMQIARGPSNAEELAEIKVKAMEGLQEDSPEWAINFVMDSIEYAEIANEKIYLISIIGIVLAGLGFLAAWMMYKLKKNGFWLYLVYTGAAIAQPLVLAPGNKLGILMALFGAIISAVFIILYAVQLKRME